MKKYLLISEVAELLNISQSRLRYIEKVNNFKIVRIRGRRYYQASDITKISKQNDNGADIIIQEVRAKNIIPHKNVLRTNAGLLVMPFIASVQKQKQEIIQLDFFSLVEKNADKNNNQHTDRVEQADLDVTMLRLKECRRKLLALL